MTAWDSHASQLRTAFVAGAHDGAKRWDDRPVQTNSNSRNHINRWGAVCALAWAFSVGCRSGGGEPSDAKPQAFPVEALGRFYRANALIEMDQEPDAGKLLESLLASIGREPAVVANLAVVRMAAAANEAALGLAQEAEAAAPDNSDIALILASVLRANGRHADAIAGLRRAIEQHPDDIRLRWALLQGLEVVGAESPDAPLVQHEAILRSTPTNLAALLGAARAAVAANNVERADQWLRRALAQIAEPPSSLQSQLDELDEVVAKKDVARLRSIVMRTRNLMLATDRYQADVIALGVSADQSPPPVRHPVWNLAGEPKNAITAQLRFEALPNREFLSLGDDAAAIRRIVVGAIAADRAPALFAIDEAGNGHVFVGASGRYEDRTLTLGLSEMPPCRNVVFLDLDNDRRIDLFISSREGDRYFRQRDDGRFEDVTAAIGLGPDATSAGAQPFDYDNDGDLDLLRWDASRLYLHQNDGEGKLTAIASRPGLPMEIPDVQSVRTLDLDDDGDVDLFITAGTGPYSIRIISNERLASFRDVTDSLTNFQKDYLAPPEVADLDNDGWLEIIDVMMRSSASFGPAFEMGMFQRLAAADHPAAVAIADFDNNGELDTIFVNGSGRTGRDDVSVSPGATLTPVDLDADGLVDLLASSGDAFMNKTSGAGNWLRVGLVGLNTGDSRFNALGIGSTIEIRCGTLYQKRPVVSATTHFGLGPHAQADVMRVVWPNGNYQSLEYRANSKTALAGNRQIIEEQTLKGSCPYLYAWNGERFEFVTDVLWRSALGMSIMQGVYGHHGTADDYFKIDGDRLAPDDGAYRLSFTEELWETSYFDYCRLLVIDHPAGTEIYADEKCLNPPFPPFEILKVAERRYPLSARDGDGRDVGPLLRRLDGRYVADFKQTRYQGLVEMHDLNLDLGAFESDAPVRLFLQGWLWPTDASTNVAVSQNPIVAPLMPQLQVVAEDGSWVDSERVVGFPSGKSKTIAVDLTGAFPTADHRVRLRTNFCIYWDHVFFTAGAQEVDLRVSELPVERAELRERGISYQYPMHPGGPRIPEYDALDPDAQWRDLIGGYTKLGDVTDLLTHVDDQYAIVGAGDEVMMWFNADAAPETPNGWVRDFIIHTDGWLKDGDLNSASGKTVGPLPWHGMPGYPEGALRGDAEAGAPGIQTRHRNQSPFRQKLRQ